MVDLLETLRRVFGRRDRITARCTGCFRRFGLEQRVADFECPVCGGTVRVPDEGQAERRRVTHAAARLFDLLSTLRWLSGSVAFAAAIALGGLLLEGDSSPVLLALLGATTAVATTGAFRAHHEPLLWMVLWGLLAVGGLLATLPRATWTFDWEEIARTWHLRYTRGLPTGVMVLVVSAMILWALRNAWLTHRLLQEHPDLRMVRRLRGERMADEGRVSRSSAQRHAQARQRAILKAIGFGGLAVILAFAAGSFLEGVAGTPPVEPSILAVQEAWNEGDWAAVGEHFSRKRRQERERDFHRWLSRRGWWEAPPFLEGPELQPSGRTVTAAYSLEDHTLEFRWSWDEGRWTLGNVIRR